MNNPLVDEAAPIAVPTGMQAAARQMTIRCLRRWDGFLGFRAGHDGLGNPVGIWMGKFEGVRFAVMLLAMQKLNAQLQLRSEADPAGESTQALHDPRVHACTACNLLIGDMPNKLSATCDILLIPAIDSYSGSYISHYLQQSSGPLHLLACCPYFQAYLCDDLHVQVTGKLVQQ